MSFTADLFGVSEFSQPSLWDFREFLIVVPFFYGDSRRKALHLLLLGP
jgi:hypothetical protein